MARRYRKEKYYEWERNYFLYGKHYSEYHIALESDSIYSISHLTDKGYIKYFDSPQSNRNEQNLTSYFIFR